MRIGGMVFAAALAGAMAMGAIAQSKGVLSAAYLKDKAGK